MKRTTKLIILCTMLIIFVTLGIMVKDSSDGILFDIKIMDYIHRGTNPIILEIMRIISFIGSEKFLIPGMAMVMSYTLVKKRYYVSKLLLISTLDTYILNFLLKRIFNRTRPLEYFLVEQSGLSFPSGHSMVTMAFYSTVAYLLAKKMKDKKKIIYIIAYTLIALMGISRLYLGVHWPTDIVGGYIAGYLFFYIFINLIKE